MNIQSWPRWLSFCLFLFAWFFAYWRAPSLEATFFIPPSNIAASGLPAKFSEEMLPRVADSAHAASLTELPDGRLAAAWFAGSREGAGDVAIWFSVLEGNWSTPRAIATRQIAVDSTSARVKKVGNPVIFAEGGKLHLWFVSVGIGGWAGSSINHSFSADGGETWTPPKKLYTSPFFNISTLVRTPPVTLADGGLGLPVYHEFISKHAEWLHLSPDGRVADKVRMTYGRKLLQPSVVALDSHRALVALRDAGPGPGNIHVTSTESGGDQWLKASPSGIANPNSSVALLRMQSGRLLMAANPDGGRDALLLWLSDDDGGSWKQSRVVEAASDAEFSYPAFALGKDGMIHLAYTWRRQSIKHVSFSEAWLEEAVK